MKASVLPPSYNDSKQRKREMLKKLSEEKKEKWPNTLEALRLKKESFLAEKAQREEEVRQEIDRQEAELRRTTRLELIKRANDLMYDQTDKMKGLKSQKAYADVVYDRAKQVEEKKVAKEAERVWGLQFHEQILKRVADGDAEETKKIEKRHAMVKVLAVARKEQVDDVLARRAAEAAEAYAIGQAIKVQAKKQIEDDIIAQEAKQKRIAESNASMVLANERQKVVREEIRQKEVQAALERDAEKEVIEGRKIALKALEKRRFEKAQETRQKIIDAAVRQLAAKSNADAVLMEKQADEIKEKQDKAFADKEAKIKKQREDIDRSRQEMIKSKEEIADQRYDEEERMVKLWNAANQAEIEKERQKEISAREKVVRLKSINYSDAVKAQKKKVEERIIQIEQDKLLKDIGSQDDDKFAEICKAEIMRYASQGKPVYTLMRALESTEVRTLMINTASTRPKPTAIV